MANTRPGIAILLAAAFLAPGGSTAAREPSGAGPLVSRGEGTSLLSESALRKSDSGGAGEQAEVLPAPGRRQPYGEAIDRAVADAVHTFLGDYLSPRALAQAEEHLTRRIERDPDQFVPNVKVVSLGRVEGLARAQVETRISMAALRGALLELVPPRSILFVVRGTEADRETPEGTVSARIIDALREQGGKFTCIDPGELETIFAKRPELRGALGGDPGASELGLRVLAELVCAGTLSVEAEETHIDGVYVGVAAADLRVIACGTAEVVAALSVRFRDRVPARRAEAVERARRAIYENVARELVAKVPARRNAGLRISCDLGPIYTALLSGYRARPFGRIRVRNAGSDAVGPLQLTLGFDDGLMLEPFTASVPTLAPGSETEIPVLGILDSRLVSLGAQEVAARVALEKSGGETVQQLSRAVVVHEPHVFSWREPQAVAAYIDPDDAAVKAFLGGIWRALPAEEFPTRELARAAAIHGALTSCGLRYREDTSGPAVSLAPRAVNDRISYPGELLREGAGDCDDFAVLLASMFEAAGLRSAVIVGRSHVLVAVETGLAPAERAAEIFGHEGILIRGGLAWWPVETTALARAEPFLTAWRSAWPAGKELVRGEAEFVDVRTAWETWRPVRGVRDAGGASDPLAATSPARPGLGDALRQELAALGEYGRARLAERADALRREGNAGSERLVGNLYAACGMYAEAREAYARAIGGDDPFAVRFNLGEVLLMGPRTERNLEAAVSEFRAALRLIPAGDLPARADTLLRLALAHRLAGDVESEEKALAQACAIDPTLEDDYEAMFESPTKGSDTASPRLRRFLSEGLK